jgi:predicted amidohydrolase
MPNHYLTVGLYHVDTKAEQHSSTGSRLKYIRMALDKFMSETLKNPPPANSSVALPPGGTPKYMFVAPEYTFANPIREKKDQKFDHFYGVERYVEEKEKDEIYNELRAISKNYPEVLLLPGSIAWRKPLTRAKDAKYVDKGKTYSAHKPGTVKTSSRADKAFNALLDHANYAAKLAGGDVDRDGGALDGHQTPTYIDKAVEVLDPSGYMAQNTLYGFLGGACVLKYAKQGDFHEVTSGAKTTFIPGVYKGPFTIGALTLGIEICLDHVWGFVRPKINGTAEPLIHLVISAYAKKQDHRKSQMKQGGYFVHCSSKYDYNEIEQKIGVEMYRVKPRGGDMLKGGIGVFDLLYRT